MMPVSLEHTSDLDTSGIAEQYRVQASTMVRIHLCFLSNRVVMGPIRSRWSSSKGQTAFNVLCLNEALVIFERVHDLQTPGALIGIPNLLLILL